MIVCLDLSAYYLPYHDPSGLFAFLEDSFDWVVLSAYICTDLTQLLATLLIAYKAWYVTRSYLPY